MKYPKMKGGGVIAEFEPLEEGVAEQTVEVGTELSELTLPDVVSATVRYGAWDDEIPDEEESVASPSDAEEEIPVSWDSEPVYDGDTEGEYVFTADVGDYALSGGAKLPQITVTVRAETAEEPIENPPEEPKANGTLVKTITGWTFVDDENLNEGELTLIDVSMEQQVDFDMVVSMLPTQISAEIEDEAEADTVDITGWDCPEYIQDGEGNWPLTGDYTFTAALPEGYACDLLPEVKVLLGGGNLYSSEYGGLTITGGAVTKYEDGQIGLADDDGNYKISGTWNGTLTGVAWNNEKTVITVPDGVTANVTLSNLTINVGSTDGACAFAVAAGGTANITLEGTNALTSGDYRAGLEVPENAKATIDGSGSLITTGGYSSAGIGGGSDDSGGTIEISGGAVTTTGGHSSAGIGGGFGGSGGTIEISGGAVTATGDSWGAGIGGGHDGNGGTIKISGGMVKVTGGSGAAGIGGGVGGGSGDITINGTANVIAVGGDSMDAYVSTFAVNGTIRIGGSAVVNATGGEDSSGIGGGSGSESDGGAGIGGGGGVEDNNRVEISGDADVTARGGDEAAGIGGGDGGNGGTIEISGDADVTARGGDKAAGIGGGDGGNGGNITISNGTVNAYGGDGINGGAGIGGGYDGSGGVILISGGIIHAEGGTGSYKSGAGIGGGGSPKATGTAGDITVNGNTVVFAKGGNTGVNAIGSGENSSDTTAPTLTEGVVFEGDTGTVHGSPELPGDLTIPAGSTLTVPDGSTLTIPDGMTLTIPDGTTLTNNGTIENYGAISGGGSISNSGTINDHNNGISVSVTGTKVNKPSVVSITFWKDGKELTDSKAIAGENIEVQANVTQKNTRLRKAAPDEVIFKTGSTVIGTASVTNGIATRSLTLTGDSWKPGSYTITAEYGGGTGLLPNDTGSATLIVEAPSYTITASPATLDFGSKTVNDGTVPDAQTVTVTNTGNSSITGYDVSGNTNFDVTYASGGISVGGNVMFTVQPKTDLMANTYEETLTITTTEGSKATVTARFVVTGIYTVTFDLAGGTRTGGGELVQTVPAGSAATAPTATYSGYTFTGWDKAFSQVTADMTVTAQWKKNSTTSSGSSSGGGGSTYTNPDILHGTWLQTDTGIWMFQLTTGGYAKNRWGLVNGLWYYFDGEGQMLAGWYFSPSYQKWFYLGDDGAMVTGWKEIEGRWYYFNPVADGTGGSMVTDRVIDSRWYVGPDGVWDGKSLQ